MISLRETQRPNNETETNGGRIHQNGSTKNVETGANSGSTLSLPSAPHLPRVCKTESKIIRGFSSSLRCLYDSNVYSKIWAIAAKSLGKDTPPTLYPEYTKPGSTEYVYRDLQFWTSGFFPGSLHVLLERRRKWRHIASPPPGSDEIVHDIQLEFACKWWTASLYPNASFKGTHDLGFMIMPWAKVAWELNRDTAALSAMTTAAQTLFDRFDERIGCMRSWDTCVTNIYQFNDPATDFLVIIDNMMNLNILFYIAAATGNQALRSAAITHARTTQRTHIRPDGSTTHVVVFDPDTGAIKDRLTNQGYAHESCWARGQAWAICGFAETYLWTMEDDFLSTAMHCADSFVGRLPETGIPPWDFDALTTEGAPQPPDTSAALIAAYGMLLIHQALVALGSDSTYLTSALHIVENVCTRHMNPAAEICMQKEAIETVEYGVLQEVTGVTWDTAGGDTIVNGATINNFEHAPRKWADHGLVYADYFFLLVGNKLLEMGIGSAILNLPLNANATHV
ncbi:Six-hairpin glycosidase-like protein [Xylariaceae sp. FL0016]|nr:Six-hairpin glycosidase-like protein [Xylariaceae sp. FL0016]